MGTRTSKRTGYTCVRHTLCGINLFFWFVGCGILGVGLWLHFSYGGYASLFPSYRLLSADGLSIAAGVISFLVAFLGCCGSWFQSKCLLGSYFALVVFIFILQFIAGTLGFVYRKEVAELLQTELKAGVQETYRPDGPLAETWDHIHRKLSCCGVHGHKDWFDAEAWPGQERVPESCCVNNLVIRDDENQSNPCNTTGDPSQWHSSGCYRKLHLWLMERLYIVGVVGMSFAFVQLFGLIAALLIVCTGGEKRRRR